MRKLAAANPANTQLQRDVMVSLNRIGDAELAAGDKAAAFAAFDEAVAIGRKLVAIDAGNVVWQTGLVFDLWKAQSASNDTARRKAMLGEAADILQALADQNKLSDGQKSWIDMLKKTRAGLDESGSSPSGG